MTRQVLAEPDAGPASKRPGRGSPTARRWSPPTRRGKGLIVLFHVTADTTWSNLPLSGLFVEMLRAHRGAQANAAPARRRRRRRKATRARCRLPHARRLRDARRAARRRRADRRAGFAGAADAKHPPGFYGAARALSAVNALRAGETLAPADYAGLPRRAGGLDTAPPIDLKPWLLLAAFLAFLVDTLASLWYSAPARFWRGRAAAPRRVGAAARSRAVPHAARRRRSATQAAALQTRLGYVADRRRGRRRDHAARPRSGSTRGARAAHLGRRSPIPSGSTPRATSSPSIR